jgi:hypothetical protein
VRAADEEEAWFISGPSGTTDFKRTCHSLERRLQELQEIQGFLKSQSELEPRAEERGPAMGARKRTTRSPPVLEGQAVDKRPRTAATPMTPTSEIRPQPPRGLPPPMGQAMRRAADAQDDAWEDSSESILHPGSNSATQSAGPRPRQQQQTEPEERAGPETRKEQLTDSAVREGARPPRPTFAEVLMQATPGSTIRRTAAATSTPITADKTPAASRREDSGWAGMPRPAAMSHL